MGGEPAGYRGRRTDARRNHERILAAATEVFAERGLRGTVPEIAHRAGVGKATVYRSYPAKDDLVVAVATARFAELERRTAGALATVDASAALSTCVVDLFDTLARDRLLADTLADGAVVASTRILESLGRILTAAKETGRIRDDAGEADIRILLCGAVLQLMRMDVRDAAVWRRCGELVVNALRPR